MIVVCPGCAAHYGIDREAFGSSARPVRCSACGHEWEAVPGELDTTDVDPAETALLADHAGDNPIAGLSDGAPSHEGVSADPSFKHGDGVAAAPSEQLFADDLEEDGSRADKIISGEGLRSHGGGEQAAQPDLPPQEAVVFSELDEDSLVTAEAAMAADDRPSLLSDAGEPALPRPRRRLILAAGGTAVLVLLILVLVAAQRPIARALPGSAVVYSFFGLAPAPPGAGLDIRDVSSSREWSGTEDVLIVAGTVANVATGVRGLPQLRVALFDADHAEVQAVVVQPVKATLAEGESVPFVARIPNPAMAARRLVVSFQLPSPEHG